jgi:hypothetical protein
MIRRDWEKKQGPTTRFLLFVLRLFVILAATFIQHALEEYAAGSTKLINKMQTSVI